MYVTLRGTPGTERAAGRARTTRRRVPGAIIAFGIVSMLTDVSSESVSAILPLYITTVLGLGPLAYGFIDGIYQGVSAAVRLLGGWWADSTQRPKWVAFVGYAVSALSRFGLLAFSGFAAVTAAVSVDRLGKGLRTGPRDALIATASDPAELGRNFGVHRALDTLGALIGPLIAFAVLATVPLALGGYKVVFVFSAAFAVLGVAVLAVAVPDLRNSQAAARPAEPDGTGSEPSVEVEEGPVLPHEGTVAVTTPPSGRRRLALRLSDLARPELRRVLVVAGVLGVATVGDGFIYLALSSGASLAATYFPLLFVGTNAAYLALAIPLGRLADRIGRGWVFLGGHVLLALVYVLAASGIGGPVWAIGVLLLLGTFYAATDGVLAALATQTVPEESRASGIAAAQTVVAVARFVSSLGFGLLWTVAGRAPALWIMTGLLVVCLAGAAYGLRSVLAARPAEAAA